MHVNSGDAILRRVISDLQRQAQWSDIIQYIEENSNEIHEKQHQSPALYAKHKRWLLNTERLTISQVLVMRHLSGKASMSQGEFVRLLAGNPQREGMDGIERREIQTLQQYWANQIRNNIRPIMADYFGLIITDWADGGKPGNGEYSIRASELLINFFKTRLYADATTMDHVK